jgi:CRP-like cAMP-binding protein
VPSEIDKLGALSSVHLFSRCDSRVLTVLARRSDIRSATAGTVFCEAGVPGGALRVIVAGEAVATDEHGSSTDLGPGATVAQLALITDEPHRMTVIVTKPTTVVELSVREFRGLLDDVSQLATGVLATLAHDVLFGPPSDLMH